MIELLNLHGKEHPVRVSYYAIKRTKLEQQKKGGKAKDDFSIEDVLSGDIELLEPLLFYGLEAGYKAQKEESPFKREDAEILLDECFWEFLEMMPKFFPTIETGKKPNPRITKNKKKP